MKEYVVGSGVELALETRDRNGVLADPAAIRLVVTSPSGVETTYNWPGNITRDSLGKFRKDIVANAAGIWIPVWNIDENTAAPGVVSDPIYVYTTA